MANFSDSFTDTNGVILTAHTPDVGTSWTKLTGSTANDPWNIQSDALSGSNFTDQKGVWACNPAQATADYKVGLKIVTALPGANKKFYGPVGRCLDADNFYAVEIQPVEGLFRLMSRVGGINSQLGSAAQAPAVNDVVELDMSGSTIRCLVNASSIISAPNSDLTAAGQGGLYGGSMFDAAGDFNVANDLDDFAITEAGAPAAVGAVVSRRVRSFQHMMVR